MHGFSENLEHITLDEIHSMPIISACNISKFTIILADRKYVTADEHILNIWEIAETKKLIINQKFEEKISKVIFSGEKLIIAASIEQM